MFGETLAGFLGVMCLARIPSSDGERREMTVPVHRTLLTQTAKKSVKQGLQGCHIDNWLRCW